MPRITGNVPRLIEHVDISPYYNGPVPPLKRARSEFDQIVFRLVREGALLPKALRRAEVSSYRRSARLTREIGSEFAANLCGRAGINCCSGSGNLRGTRCGR